MNNDISIEQAVIAYLQFVKNTMSENTYRAYSMGINKFINFLQAQRYDTKKPIDEINEDHFLAFINDLEENRSSRATLELIIASLTRFRNWLHENEYFTKQQPVERYYQETVKYILHNTQRPGNKSRNMGIFPEELLESAMHVNLRDIELKRNMALIHFLLSTDSKPYEICKIYVKNIDLYNQTSAVNLAGSRTRILSFSRDTANAITQYWDTRGWQDDEDPAFARHDRGAGKRHLALTTRSIQNIVQAMCQIAGLEGEITPTDLRIGYYLNTLNYQIDLIAAEKVINFNSFNTSRQYKQPNINHARSK